MRRLGLTVAGALLALFLAGCGGGHGRGAHLTPLPGQTAASENITEEKLIAEFHRLYPDAEKRAAELMDAESTVVDDLVTDLITENEHGFPLDPPLVRLSFTATNFADYDNDGAVGISDITPLAQRYGMEFDDAPSPGDLLSERTILSHPDTRHNRLVAGADGSGNGEVDIADITPIAINYNSKLAGYNIYRAEVVESLLTFSEVPLPNLLEGASELSVALAEWAEVEEAESGLSAGVAGRYVITLETEAPLPGEVFGFRTHACGDDEEGPAGNVDTVATPAEEDTVPPYWLDTVGVTATRALDEGVEVSWGAAYDAKTPPVHYRLYYSPGSELDWGSATVIDDVASPYTVYGLTTLEPYTFAVRAYDSSPAQNLELNTVTRTEYPGPRDIYPPEWQTAEGITNVVGTEDGFIVTWELAVDSFDDGETVWESDPVAYRIYWSTQSPIDFATAEYIEVEASAPEQPWQWYEFEGGFAHQARYYFAVRAVDSAEYGRNEDTNTRALYGFVPEWNWEEIYRTEEEEGESRIIMDTFEPHLLLGETRNYLVWSEHDDEHGLQRHGFRIRLIDFHDGERELRTVLDTDIDSGYEGEVGGIGSLEICGDTLYFLISTVIPGNLSSDFGLITWNPQGQSEVIISEDESADRASFALTLKNGSLYCVSYGRADDWWAPTRFDQFIYYEEEGFAQRHILYSIECDFSDFPLAYSSRPLNYFAWVSADKLINLDSPFRHDAYIEIDESGFTQVQDCWFYPTYPRTPAYHFEAVGEDSPLLFIGRHEICEKLPTPEYGLYEWDPTKPVPYSVDKYPVWTQDTEEACVFEGGLAYKSSTRKPLHTWQHTRSWVDGWKHGYYIIVAMDEQLLKLRLPIPIELRVESVNVQFWTDENMELHVIVRAVEEPTAEDYVLIAYEPVDLSV